MQWDERHWKGSEFESVVDDRNYKYHQWKYCHIKRYGVQAVRSKEEWIVIRSKPDFEGVLPNGRQLIFDAKVCSQASFGLHEYRSDTKGTKSRQLKHMLERAEYGAICFFLLHWNPRVLATKADRAITYAFWVDGEMDFWQGFDEGQIKKITRDDCERYGTVVPWNTLGPRDRAVQPDVLSAIQAASLAAHERGESYVRW